MMGPPSHGFVFDDGGGDGGPADDWLRAALAPRFSVQPDGRSRTLRHTWLDTFDWRLHRAGLTLELTAGSGGSELTLSDHAGTQVTADGRGARWPAQADALPPGPLHALLRPVTDVRALMPAARAVSLVRRWRVRNSDAKTVAYLTVDRMSVTGAAAAPSVRLGVTAVRGYQPDADGIAQMLSAAPHVAPAHLAPLDAALAATGRRAGDYHSTVDVALTVAMPARCAVTAVLLRLLDTMEANVTGTIRDTDTEFLHDLRVSVRRTRSALKLAGDVLPDGLAGRFRGEFTWLGQATTPTRDLDVYLLNYPAMAAELVAATPADLAPFRDHLARRRAGEQRRLARTLRSPRFTGLTRAWREALTSLTPPEHGPATGPFAAERIRRTYRQVLARGAAITADSPPERLHDLRKRCKELRYALEFFASLHDPGTHRKAVRGLKGLQDCLGTFQDCQVQRQEIAMFASQMMAERSVPASALLAMGELAGRVAGRQHRARGEFADRFTVFASRDTRQRFRDLTSGAGA